MLSVKDLKVNYGAIQAVKKVDIEVSQGEVVMIVGANGAGKTTIVHSIMGYVRPDEGTITFEGQNLLKIPPHKMIERGISIVPEGRRVFAEMTVKENLELGAYSVSDARRIEENIERMYVLFPRLKEREKQLAGSLSGGEQQMVAIARALMSDPKLLLMDEPSMGLAPVITEQIYENIKTIKKQNTSILLIEQNAYMAMSVAEQGYAVQNGEVVFSGEIESFKDNDSIREAYLGI